MIIFLFPQILALCFIAFSFSLKSSIEQGVLYGAAQQALGEISAEEAGPAFHQDVEARPRGLWLSFKTYAPTCALLLLVGASQFEKFPLISIAINARKIHTVKALQAIGAPLPFWALAGSPATGFRRWPGRTTLPFGRRFQPYGPGIIQSYAMTKFLIEKGVDVNIRLLLDGSWTPPRIGNVTMTPLHVALTAGKVEIARMMIAHGADVHARDSIGRSPLTVAITYCPSAIELLLASGVDLNEQTRFGPPLLAAARYQWLYHEWRLRPRRMLGENAVKILLEKGADPNTLDSDGRNALMVMSMEYRPFGPQFMRSEALGAAPGGVSGNIFVVVEENSRALELIGETLLRAGCDINGADINGRTPLMYAVRYQRPTAVRLLLERGANIKARDKDGMTALELAKKAGNQEIIKLLQSASVESGTAKKPGGAS